MTRRFAFLAIWLLLLTGVFAFPASAQRSPKLDITATASPSPVRPGEYLTVTVSGKIAEGWHIYSVVPVDGPTPTTVKVEGENLTTVGEPGESKPERKFDPNFKTELGQHEGNVTFTQAVQVDPTATGSLVPKVTVRYQACDATSCLPPQKAVAEVLAISVEAGAVRPEYAKKPENAPAPASQPTSGNPLLPAKGEHSGDARGGQGDLLGFLVFAFVSGLAALVTPCVFPMIPVTLAFFTKQAAANNTSIVKLAAIYSLGIVGAFTGIGAILAATIGAAGANRLAASPWTNLIFGVLFLVFGLALLEIFELKLPSSLQSLSGKGRQTGGTVGVLLMGLTFVIAAFTCTAPFIGTVLVAASTAATGADWVRPILGMTLFATALALPFFLLALFPGLLAKLPKSGSWLTTVKGAMGFLEIGAAIKFLSNADLVWQWQIITQPFMLALWAIIALAGGAWLLGKLYVGFNTPDSKVSIGRGVSAAIFFAFAVYCLYGLTGRPLQRDLLAFLPPPGYGYNTNGTTGLQANAEEVEWLDTVEAGIERAKAEGKPILIDFTGYTCTNCRWMEQNIFPVANVKSEMEQFVRVRLFTDDPKIGEKWQEYQEKNFGTIALPLYAILTPDGKPVGSVPYTPNVEAFTDFLKTTRNKAGSNSVSVASQR